MRAPLILAVACLAGLLGSSQVALGQSFPTKAELMTSCWDSVYTTRDGRKVAALIEFDGRNGTYDTPFGQGRLSNIQYGVDTQSNPGNPFFQITGRWSFLGETGTFTFASDGGDMFRGSWNSNSGGGGRWSGSRSY